MGESTFSCGPFKTIHNFRGGIRKCLSFEDDWEFENETPYWIRIIEKNLCLDMYIYLKETKNVIFSGQDALIEGRKDLPYFYRTKWAASLPCSFITFNDPSLYLSDAFGAGYFCLPNSWSMVKRAVDKIISSCGYLESNIFFYGASAGGYWALSMAGSYPESTFVVDIPQVNLETYFRDPTKTQFKKIFNIDDVLPSVFSYWGDAVFPKQIFYLQNSRDGFHIRTQESFFLRRASEVALNNSNRINNINFIFYETPPDTRAHSPLPQEKTINFLTQVIEGRWRL